MGPASIFTKKSHVTLAMKNDPHTMVTPVVLSKGYDVVAALIKVHAVQHGIVQVENGDLACVFTKEVLMRKIVLPRWFKVLEKIFFINKLKRR